MAYPNAWAPYPPNTLNDPAYNQMYPQQLPYEEGAPIPLGYRKVESRRTGLLIAGAVTFGVFYAPAVFGALVSSEGQYAIPVVGPFLGVERPSRNSLSGVFTSFANFFLIFDGIGQAAGAAMLIAGIPTKTTLMRNDVATFKPEFSVGPGSVGMRMRF